MGSQALNLDLQDLSPGLQGLNLGTQGLSFVNRASLVLLSQELPIGPK